MSNYVNPEIFKNIIGGISDGYLFESFAKQFIAALIGLDFSPAGGIHDRGIDGLERCFEDGVSQNKIYQISIQKTPDIKLKETAEKLIKNNITFDSIIYITNQTFPNLDRTIIDLENSIDKGIGIKVWDINWLSSRVNTSSATQSVYNSYISEPRAPTYYIDKQVSEDFISDPRLFVYLRQQWETGKNQKQIGDIVIDSLILYVLEGTDPDKGIAKNAEQIKREVPAVLTSFHMENISKQIDERLEALSTKPRRIRYDSRLNGYILPYATRLAIHEQVLLDEAIYKHFIETSSKTMERQLSSQNIPIKNPGRFVEKVVQKLHYQSGLEFSSFILSGQSSNKIETNIGDIILEVIEESDVKRQYYQTVKDTLLVTIREIVYRGDSKIKEYLKKLSNTYLMMFSLQWDPKVARFFQELASRLEVFVCTSIIIPAISEIFLDVENRRHYNLLVSANKAGVKLYINDFTIEELITHLKAIKSIYINTYYPDEEIYLDIDQMLYVEEILIRAYYHAKISGKIADFDEFLDQFVNPDFSNSRQGLIDWLQGNFGIAYKPLSSWAVEIDEGDESELITALTPYKKNREKAVNDVKTVLTIYALREKNGEMSSDEVYGYRTWWLSKDVSTYRVISEKMGDKYQVSCYMRPDFLYNYIALAPSTDQIDRVYTDIFPSLIGVNIGRHIDSDIVKLVHEKISQHRKKGTVRIKSIIKELTEKIKYDSNFSSKQKVSHYLEDELNKLETGKRLDLV
ncbi:MAG: hypothetical protein ACOYKD_02645 [Anaerolineaceae bacterium]|jgi:hypothetical protein